MLAPRRGAALALAGAVALGLLVTPASLAQIPPLTGTSTTTTTVPPTSSTSAPSGGDLSAGGDEAPEGAVDAKGDGAQPPAGGIRVPPEAQRIIDAVRRTPPSNSRTLLSRMADLQALGLSEAEAFLVGFGRFPIAGAAHYGDDWLYPRYGPGFRFHLGTDVFAAHGTPVRAPVDGVATSSNGGLGGLSVKVTMPDGTYFYLAHLSGLADGFAQGMPVTTGTIVGYVGDSGNARGGAPHVHLGIYPRGGDPINPKPVLDQFLAEAEGRLPAVIDAYQRSKAAAPPADAGSPPVTDAPPLTRPRATGAAALSDELLYVIAANPLAGPRSFLEQSVDDLAARIDWSAR